jgi:hypothetical protein
METGRGNWQSPELGQVIGEDYEALMHYGQDVEHGARRGLGEGDSVYPKPMTNRRGT